MNPKHIARSGLILSAAFFPAIALAHVVVKPAQVGVGSFETYSIGVPNEKDQATVGVRLVLPSGLHYVTPTVKSGWKIDTKQTGEGEDATVTEINWTEGSVPSGQRDDFTFAAQAPEKATSVNWKAYQTYADGSVVSWDQTPSAKESDDDSSDKGPYSTTKVVDDLTPAAAKGSADDQTGPYLLSGLALVVALASLFIGRRKRS